MTIIPENLSLKSPVKHKDNFDIHEKIIRKFNSTFHEIKIVQNDLGRFIKYKDTYQAGYIKTKSYEGNLPYINYFLIPCLMNKNIKDVLFIGLGSGYIIKQYKKLFKIKRLDIVDIEEYSLEIAEKYFDFCLDDNTNFYLQDALIFLKTAKKKYDLIVVDVADNHGIDERFCEIEYLNLIKKHLKKEGIFVSNMPSSRDIFNKKNKFFLGLINKYKNVFKHIKLYNGETSNKIFYKTFFNSDNILFDITNIIMISSEKDYNISSDYKAFNELKVNIAQYLDDLISC